MYHTSERTESRILTCLLLLLLLLLEASDNLDNHAQSISSSCSSRLAGWLAAGYWAYYHQRSLVPPCSGNSEHTAGTNFREV